MDKNKDGLISLSEFLNYADLDVFNTNAEWEPLEQRDEIVFPEVHFECSLSLIIAMPYS